MKRYIFITFLSLLFFSQTVTAEETYFTAKGFENGKVLVFRGKYAEGIVKSNYPYLLRIYWHYSDINKSGMPDSPTMGAQFDFEEDISKLDTKDLGQLVLVVTGNSRKEWVWYVKNPIVWKKKFNKVLKGKKIYPIKIVETYQPDWDLYSNFMRNLKD
ncbi:uncharacterized protein DUF695 [Acinetobacter sp. BIGb0102]|uniref:DUF695 domain-containing protein n=1 Tax=Acinetobacter sp. BIGb0102 TaxID=2485131 RepID=UPI000F513B55|nr:DUF695 domain-containing protein [Acinetobacter sp. BIGb0102]RPE30111.1 uncharacterized protein DUF695 [Acinetobacter sp. BIGb0102]